MAIPRALQKWAKQISDIMVDGDGSWNVGLKPGFICGLTETHQVYEGSLAEVIKVFKAGWVTTCNCPGECFEACKSKKGPKP